MRLVRVLGIALLLGGCSGPPPPPWTFTAPEGQYSVQLPGTHKNIQTKTDTADGPRGQITGRMHLTENNRYPIELYGIGHMDAPGLSEAIPNPLTLVGMVVDVMLKEMHSRVTQQEPILFDGGVGTEADWQGNYKGVAIYGKVRCYAMHDRVVFLMFAGRQKSCVGELEGKQFFKSFAYNGPK